MKTSTSPNYIVDLTKVESCDDIKLSFIRGKALAGIKLTEGEFRYIIRYGAEIAMDTIENFVNQQKAIVFPDVDMETAEKVMKILQGKKPWYKRFWNWITKPFKKNK